MRNSMSDDGPSVPKRRLHAPLFSLSTYDLHKRLVNNYILSQQGATAMLVRDTSRDRRDIDVIRESHQFLWDSSDVPNSWEERLAKKYYDKLFKEYCICDLTKYKDNKVAMRWRTEEEVVVGKGQFECGEKRCKEREGLRTWEVNFGYLEKSVKKNALVKLRLCANCSTKLNYHHTKREIISAKSRKRKRDYTSDEADNQKRVHGVESNEEATSTTVMSSVDQQEEEDDGNAWKDGNQNADEKSREEEFQDYLEELLL